MATTLDAPEDDVIECCYCFKQALGVYPIKLSRTIARRLFQRAL